MIFLYTIKKCSTYLQDAPTLRLNLRRTSADKKVSWNSNTVDNENMGKKKSKCKSRFTNRYLLKLEIKYESETILILQQPIKINWIK